MNDNINIKFSASHPTVNADDKKISESIFDESYEINQKMIQTEEEFIFQTISPFCDRVYEARISKKELTEAIWLYLEVQSLKEMGIDPYGFMGKVQTNSDIARKAYGEGREAGKAEMKERIINAMENLVGGGSDE